VCKFVVGSERLNFPQDLAQKLSRSFDMSGEGDQQSLLMDGEGSQMPRRRQSMQRLTARGMPMCGGDLQEVNEDGMVIWPFEKKIKTLKT
jgi:hypothetical protein